MMSEELHKQILEIGNKMRCVFEEMKEANITDFDYFRDALTEEWKEIDQQLKCLNDLIDNHFVLEIGEIKIWIPYSKRDELKQMLEVLNEDE